MLGVKLDSRARRVLTVTTNPEAEVSVDTTPGSYFPLRITAPEGPGPTSDGSPRTSAAVHSLWFAPRAELLNPGDRLEVFGGDVLELLSKPAAVNVGRRTTGYQVSALPVDVLYPRSADVFDQGDATPVAEDVELSIYSPTDTVRGTGDSRDYFAEAPAAHQSVLTQNRIVRLGSEDFRIIGPTLSRELPYVAMTLRGN